jgi:phage terminase large subunit-like protein
MRSQLPATLSVLEAERTRRKSERRLTEYRPYAKQRLFHALGASQRVRGLFGANQSGKSICGSAETAIHLTGQYPEWWQGYRFDRPIRAWAAGETGEATRDNVQAKLIGPPERAEDWGTGYVPRAAIIDSSRAMGVANLLDSVSVKHASGGTSTLWFKRYEQGRAKWQGPTLDWLWLDEEPPWDIFSEGMTRTNAVPDARIILTFTALSGMTELIKWLLSGKPLPSLAA